MPWREHQLKTFLSLFIGHTSVVQGASVVISWVLCEWVFEIYSLSCLWSFSTVTCGHTHIDQIFHIHRLWPASLSQSVHIFSTWVSPRAPNATDWPCCNNTYPTPPSEALATVVSLDQDKQTCLLCT